MSHSHTSINIHYVFTPLGRIRIESPETRSLLGKYIKGICTNLDAQCTALHIMPDHVHLLVRLPAKLPVAELAQKIKGNSARYLNTLPTRKCRFVWQAGYGAFSCSFSLLEKAVHYIQNQEEHHQKHTFQEEYCELLDKHQMHDEVPSSAALRTQ